jgi:hypothetical protein
VPASAFSPIASVEEVDGSYIIRDDKTLEAQMVQGFIGGLIVLREEYLRSSHEKINTDEDR